MQIMQTQIHALEQKVNSQELRNAEKDSEIRALRKQVEQTSQDLTSLPAYDFLKEVKLSGYMAATLTENFDNPSTQANLLRTFDINAHSFNTEAFKLTLQKDPTEASRAGFRVDIFGGRTARLLGFATANTPVGTNNLGNFELEQAYVTYKADVGKGLDLYAGKFVTLLGAEVLESPLNYNISRSILFGFAIPFTHTGLRATYAFNDKWNATVGVNNGWDNEDENNHGFSYEGRLAWVPSDKFNIAVNTIYGPELAGNEADKRGVLDVVATWKPTEKLTLLGNFDWGQQHNAPFDLNGDGIPEFRQTATWTGAALVANYDFTNRFGLAVRGEYFEDRQGFRTGLRQNAWEYTITPHYQLTPKLLTRVEMRGDYSDMKYFLRSQTPNRHQETILGEVVYLF
ncbi:MAG: hypothetical protein A2Y95_09180 [Deltaproteobacteria bacterium RBG_13_65_10]|nr:MAG: hypothetical protein A2Y95_09180 [Deltaproteobacteria bacterium RBG_13_65_10]